ncbi:Putative major facilitator superfamily, MFS transporter superfamily [Septoria linicola]|uniref:Major facilitator superfamily, MFS transporter superfamily n=1 Tax=Septoria linicola TaxID=215465 RepID=A0A9Q9EHJ3_9PEZI|nr:putative major facilitator superfamily, MFS transporter superfamily [Septoria linicola]USW49997.1 Putative major facilitator superfamily, MFS transporter superfamily [Septoria linicola]
MAFLVISVLVATAKTWTGFLILRFLQGFFGSPCLANGGASMHDLFKGPTVPYSMAMWIAAAYCGSALGPLISSHLVSGHGWRMGMWETVWMAAPTLVLVLILPETYGPALEVQSDKRRSILSQQHFGPAPARDPGKNKLRLVFGAIGDAARKPIQIMLQDPAVHVANGYTTFVYATYYTFFDAFPQVYLFEYHFTVGGLGLAFTSIVLGCVLGGAAYCAYIKWGINEQFLREPLLSHEGCLRPALVACVLPPLGLFLFGWSARSSIHWIISLVGVTIYAAGVYIILQCLSVYLPRIYPRYAASLFAANDLCRSCTAAALIHAGVPLYGRLGVSRGISVLGSISVLGIPGKWFIYWKGPVLRAKSRFVAEP